VDNIRRGKRWRISWRHVSKHQRVKASPSYRGAAGAAWRALARRHSPAWQAALYRAKHCCAGSAYIFAGRIGGAAGAATPAASWHSAAHSAPPPPPRAPPSPALHNALRGAKSLKIMTDNQQCSAVWDHERYEMAGVQHRALNMCVVGRGRRHRVKKENLRAGDKNGRRLKTYLLSTSTRQRGEAAKYQRQRQRWAEAAASARDGNGENIGKSASEMLREMASGISSDDHEGGRQWC